MKALITGIAGFAGNYLAELLLKEGLEVYGISQESEFKPFLPLDPAVRYRSADVRDSAAIRERLGEVRPDLIFHLAARSSPSQSARCPEETYNVNFGGTLTLLEAIRVVGLRCRFLLVSSSHVYGGGKGGRVREDAELRPASPYAASKAASELASWQYWKTYGIETIVVRAFNHTGPGQGPGFVCPDLARKIVEIERGVGPPQLEVRSLDRQIDFSDVRDIVQGYHKALVTGRAGEVYNLCSGKAITIRTLVEGMIAETSKSITVAPCVPEGGTEEKNATIGDNSKARVDLGWEPAIPIGETMRQVVAYWRGASATLSPSAARDAPRGGAWRTGLERD